MVNLIIHSERQQTDDQRVNQRGQCFAEFAFLFFVCFATILHLMVLVVSPHVSIALPK